MRLLQSLSISFFAVLAIELIIPNATAGTLSKAVCETALRGLQKIGINNPNDPWVDGKVSILWFPKYPEGPSASHMKLVVDGEVYNSMDFFTHQGRIEAFRRLATRGPRYGFYEFQMRFSQSELEKLKQFVKGGGYLPSSSIFEVRGCSYLSFLALEKYTGFYMPPLTTQVPSHAAGWLTLRRLKSYFIKGRVLDIQFFGQNERNSLQSADILTDQRLASYYAFIAAVVMAGVMTPLACIAYSGAH